MNMEQVFQLLGLQELFSSVAFTGLWELLSDLMPILLGATLLLGLVSCFAGYKYRHLWFMILCIFVGMGVGSWLYLSYELSPAVCGSIGALAAIFTALFYKLGLGVSIFCLNFYLFGMVFGLQDIPLLVLCGVPAIAVFFMERWVSTVVTAAVGALVAMRACSLLIPFFSGIIQNSTVQNLLAGITEQGALYYAGAVILAVLGFLVQAEPFSRNHALISFRKAPPRKHPAVPAPAQSAPVSPIPAEPIAQEAAPTEQTVPDEQAAPVEEAEKK